MKNSLAVAALLVVGGFVLCSTGCATGYSTGSSTATYTAASLPAASRVALVMEFQGGEPTPEVREEVRALLADYLAGKGSVLVEESDEADYLIHVVLEQRNPDNLAEWTVANIYSAQSLASGASDEFEWPGGIIEDETYETTTYSYVGFGLFYPIWFDLWDSPWHRGHVVIYPSPRRHHHYWESNWRTERRHHRPARWHNNFHRDNDRRDDRVDRRRDRRDDRWDRGRDRRDDRWDRRHDDDSLRNRNRTEARRPDGDRNGHWNRPQQPRHGDSLRRPGDDSRRRDAGDRRRDEHRGDRDRNLPEQSGTVVRPVGPPPPPPPPPRVVRHPERPHVTPPPHSDRRVGNPGPSPERRDPKMHHRDQVRRDGEKPRLSPNPKQNHDRMRAERDRRPPPADEKKDDSDRENRDHRR